jgi:hypothetical protein
MIPLKILVSQLLLTTSVFGQNINNYMPFTGWGICKHSQKEYVILRTFSKNSHTYYFGVSPQNLNTGILSSDTFRIKAASWQKIFSRYNSTAYIKALKEAKTHSDTLQDAGFKRFRPSQNGIDLTIDLCPSHRSLDHIVFKDLINEVGRVEKPVPLAISITGKWLNTHENDFNWLDSLVKSGELSIVWINHSYNHYTNKSAPLKMNFMLEPGTDINAEVLNTEIALLQKNVLPSVFFRFPGLVSDYDIYNKIVQLGLIPVGSDAWLAKGQKPKNGSIVLIHANGNEPVGVHDFIELFKNKRNDVMSKRWELFDLRESLIEDESK